MSRPSLNPAPSGLARDAFVTRYGGVCEDSPWVAERLFDAGLDARHDTVDGLTDALNGVIATAGRELQLALVRAHPDLAGKAAVAGRLTAESTVEQASAGLDRCSPEEFERLQALNGAYHARFGFPFIMAVRGSSRAQILDAFAARLENPPETEFQRALEEIGKIIHLRLHALADDRNGSGG